MVTIKSSLKQVEINNNNNLVDYDDFDEKERKREKDCMNENDLLARQKATNSTPFFETKPKGTWVRLDSTEFFYVSWNSFAKTNPFC